MRLWLSILTGGLAIVVGIYGNWFHGILFAALSIGFYGQWRGWPYI